MNRRPAKPFLGLLPVLGSGDLSQGGPWVEVNPDINVQAPLSVSAPINIELGGLPLSLGLFAGSALSFALRGQLEKGWAQSAALVVGAGLGAGGIINMLLPKKGGSTTSQPSSGPGGAPPTLPPVGDAGKGSYNISPEEAFDQIDARITYPGEDGQVIDLSPFAGFVPARVQVINESSVTVDFTLEMSYTESPAWGSDHESTIPFLVSVPPGAKDIPVNLPLSTWGVATDFVEVYLIAKKRRSPNTGAENLHSRTFRVD